MQQNLFYLYLLLPTYWTGEKNDQKTQEAVLDCHIFSWPSNPFRYSVILQEVNTGTVTELFDEARTNGTCLQIDSACFR